MYLELLVCFASLVTTIGADDVSPQLPFSFGCLKKPTRLCDEFKNITYPGCILSSPNLPICSLECREKKLLSVCPPSCVVPDVPLCEKYCKNNTCSVLTSCSPGPPIDSSCASCKWSPETERDCLINMLMTFPQTSYTIYVYAGCIALLVGLFILVGAYCALQKSKPRATVIYSRSLTSASDDGWATRPPLMTPVGRAKR